MSEVKWVKLQADMFENRKIRQIELLPESDGIILVWVRLICLAGQVNDNGFIYLTAELPYTAEMLAQQFNKPLSTIQLALTTFERFEMIEIIDDVIHISNWEKYQNVQSLDRIREQNRAKQQRYRDRKRAKMLEAQGNDEALRDSLRNVTQQNKNKNKNKSINTSINTSNVHPPTANAQFEQAWTLYPRKKGKGQVTERAKKELCKHTIEEIERAIGRYLKDLEKEPWRQVQNGSTFFNSGIVDYYDDTYTEDEPIKAADKAAKQWADDWSFVFEEANREENSENSS